MRILVVLLAVVLACAVAYAIRATAAADPAPAAGIETVHAIYYVDERTDLAYMPRAVLERLIASNNAFADDLRRLHAKGCR